MTGSVIAAIAGGVFIAVCGVGCCAWLTVTGIQYRRRKRALATGCVNEAMADAINEVAEDANHILNRIGPPAATSTEDAAWPEDLPTWDIDPTYLDPMWDDITEHLGGRRYRRRVNRLHGRVLRRWITDGKPE